MHRLWLLSIAILLVPTTAFAMQTTVENFRDSKVLMPWNIGGFDGQNSLSPEAPGLHISSVNPGQMMHVPIATHAIEGMSITFQANQETPAVLLWQTRDSKNGELISLDFTIPAGAQTLNFNVSGFPAWDTHPRNIGFAFPKGADVYLQDIQYHKWSLLEKTKEMWTSFWMFDELLPYSINFLWGPLFTFNPIGTSELYQALPPPRGMSFNRILLPFFGVIAVILLILWITSPGFRDKRFLGTTSALGIFALAVSCVWIFFDLRMGIEFIHNAKVDYDTYISKQLGERTFRNYLNFYDAVEQSRPILEQEEKFGLFVLPRAGLNTRSRYLLYPHEPIEKEEEMRGLKTWFVFERSDVEVTTTGTLMLAGKPIAYSGSVLQRFSPSSFLYRTAP